MRRRTPAPRGVNYASGAGAVATATLATQPFKQPITRLQDFDDRARGHVSPGNLRHSLMHIGIEWLVQGDHGGDAESAEDSISCDSTMATPRASGP